MEHSDTISTATEDAVKASKVLAETATRMDASSHLPEDYDEFIDLHTHFGDSATPSSTQVIDSAEFIRLDRSHAYRPSMQNITIGINSYKRWRRIATAHGLFTDAQIANFLTQHYENTANGVSFAARCINCNTPLSLTCIKCSLLQQSDFTQSEAMSLPADISTTNITSPSISVVASDSSLQHSIRGSGSNVLQSASTITDNSMFQAPIPVVSILQPVSSAIDDGNMLPATVPVVRILQSSSSVVDSSLLQATVPGVSGSALQPSNGNSLDDLSSTITSTNDIIGEEIKSEVLILPSYDHNSNGTGSCPSPSLLSTHTISLSSIAPVLSSPAMSILNDAAHNSQSDKGNPSKKTVKKGSKVKGEKELSCKECGCQVAQLSPSKTSSKKRKQVFHSEKPYKCSDCDAAFTHTRNLKAHFWKKHAPSGKPFNCNYCEKTFLNSRDLRTHTYKHTGEMPYKCTYCTAAFTLACNLKTHLRVHTGERPFKCKVCGKAFTESGALKVHMRKHTGERPFKCSQCEMAFPSSGNLSRHMLTHTGEKPYMCHQCSSAFSQPGSLKTHIRTHTGERPYKCKDCGAAFSDNSTLWKHKRKQSCQSLTPTASKSVTLTQAAPLLPVALVTSTTLPTVSSLPSEENQLSQQLSYRPSALNDTPFINAVNWCFPMQHP